MRKSFRETLELIDILKDVAAEQKIPRVLASENCTNNLSYLFQLSLAITSLLSLCKLSHGFAAPWKLSIKRETKLIEP